ncbi:MAG: hypothetical protein ABIH42_09955 [Planctomycetota bacterium]
MNKKRIIAAIIILITAYFLLCSEEKKDRIDNIISDVNTERKDSILFFPQFKRHQEFEAEEKLKISILRKEQGKNQPSKEKSDVNLSFTYSVNNITEDGMVIGRVTLNKASAVTLRDGKKQEITLTPISYKTNKDGVEQHNSKLLLTLLTNKHSIQISKIGRVTSLFLTNELQQFLSEQGVDIESAIRMPFIEVPRNQIPTGTTWTVRQMVPLSTGSRATFLDFKSQFAGFKKHNDIDCAVVKIEAQDTLKYLPKNLLPKEEVKVHSLKIKVKGVAFFGIKEHFYIHQTYDIIFEAFALSPETKTSTEPPEPTAVVNCLFEIDLKIK